MVDFEWLFRLGLCRDLIENCDFVLQHMQPSHLMQVIVLAIIMLSTAELASTGWSQSAKLR